MLVPGAPWHTDLDKSALSPLRLANFIALGNVASWAVLRDAAFLSNRLARAVLLCGQNSLHVFCVGILLSTHAELIEARGTKDARSDRGLAASTQLARRRSYAVCGLNIFDNCARSSGVSLCP